MAKLQASGDLPTTLNWADQDKLLRTKWTGSLDGEGKIARPSEDELLNILGTSSA